MHTPLKKRREMLLIDITSWIRYVVTDFFRIFKISIGNYHCAYFIYGEL